MEKRLFTSESVTEGHPDKICDAISDAILDALLEQDPMSRVACETCTTTGYVMVMGEITSNAHIDFQQVVRDTVREIGYDRAKYGFDCDTCGVITAIDDTDVTDMELSEVVSLIKENKDKNIVLTVQREDEETPLQITVEVTDVELPAVFSEMLDDETGYIQITQFTGVAPQQYKDAFVDLKQKGMQKLVVDLRDNPGGLLTSVCEILRDILPEGLIVYTEDKDGNREEETCDGKNELHMPLAVLVNESSASASEIFAGAVQDYGIGKIVGTTTYGKGVVQELRQLRDGSAVKLTVSNYYTPKGNSINKVGIKPDIEVKLASELLNKTEISHEEDNQLQEALKTLQ